MAKPASQDLSQILRTHTGKSYFAPTNGGKLWYNYMLKRQVTAKKISSQGTFNTGSDFSNTDAHLGARRVGGKEIQNLVVLS